MVYHSSIPSVYLKISTSTHQEATDSWVITEARGSLMQMVDNIRSTSLSHSGMVNNISSQSSIIASKLLT
ncbi:hypothetical protein CsSME_00028992 [Camellia sinensis var. sinensis]